MSCTAALRPPTWVSRRRLLEQKLIDLHRCSNPDHLKQLHAQIFKADLHWDPLVAPKLVSAYSLCRIMPHAVAAFDMVSEPNINAHLYNTLIRAHAHNSQWKDSFSAYFRMRRKGVSPDNYTFTFLLKAACFGNSSLFQVEMIHTQILKLGFLSDVFVPNSLVDSYSKCGGSGGGIAAAKKVFDGMPQRDVVSWNSMICGFLRVGELREARRLFDEMPDRDTVSWNTVLDGYVKAGETDEAFKLFERMPERNIVSWCTMVLGYSKKGDMEMARVLFDKMPAKNLVPWTIIISGYAEKGLSMEATSLFEQMEEAGLRADGATVVSILAACAESGLLNLGKRIHAHVERTLLKCTTQVCNAVLDMYAKCGNLDMAQSVFDNMKNRDLVSWNSMVQGLAMHGHGENALQLFSRMEVEGVAPDGVTFLVVLCACTHMGLVEKGRHYFSIMEDCGIIPQVEHYGCMVDLLGRGGLLKEAFQLVQSMPWEPNAIIWGTLLSACRTHNDIGLAEEVVDKLVKLEPSDAGNFAVLSNIYAAAGRWEGMAKVRLQMKGIGVQKPAGFSSIEVDDVVHEFTVGDRSHPNSDRIFRMLDRLGKHLRQVGYVPRVY